MLRLRMHGRGGQGIKTASQILGTAAFLTGYQAQDFPLYGAERRGAPVVAYTRIDHHPIRERGIIIQPDVLLIGDETLMGDRIAVPLAGMHPNTLLFINSQYEAVQLKEHYHLNDLPFQADLTQMCQDHIQKRSILSTAIAAAAARLTGLIPLRHIIAALRYELGEENIPSDKIYQNMKLAREVFHAFPAGQPHPRQGVTLQKSRMVDLKPARFAEAAPLILNPGNMAERKTGNWRVQRPEIDYEICNACGICYVRCPEGDIRLDAEGKPVIDYDHCKGCLICAAECPKHAIRWAPEVTSWNTHCDN